MPAAIAVAGRDAQRNSAAAALPCRATATARWAGCWPHRQGIRVAERAALRSGRLSGASIPSARSCVRSSVKRAAASTCWRT